MPTTKAPSLYQDAARECAMTPVRTLSERIVAREAEKRGLTFPLTAEDNRPIRDARGALVGIPERAQFFTACANLIEQISRSTTNSDEGRSEEFAEFRRQARKIMEQAS